MKPTPKLERYRLNPQAIAELPPTKRAQALVLMEQFQQRYEWNPLEGYFPTPAGLALHKAVGHDIRALFGGNRAGKTTWGVVDSILQATPKHLVPEWMMPFKRWECPVYTRVCSPSLELSRTIAVPKFREWVPKDLWQPGGWSKTYNRNDRAMHLNCGCAFFFMAYEQEVNKFGGASLHRVMYDEEPPEEIRDECEARLWDTDGEELFTMTPVDGMSWTHDEIWMNREQDHVACVSASTFENQFLPKRIQQRLARRFADDDPRKEARIGGKFIHFGGLVYPSWEDVRITGITQEFVHSCEDIVVGIDPGMTGCGLVWVAFDGSGRATVFDSLKVKDADADDVARFIELTNEKWNLTDPVYVIDPSARARSLSDGQSMEEALQSAGVYCAYGSSDREGGCMMLRKRIRQGHVGFAVGMVDFEWEIKRYRVKEREDGKWDVIKVHDHVMDAMRYAVGHFAYVPPDELDEAKSRRRPGDAFGPSETVDKTSDTRHE